ncbi:MAG: hypothetical protein EON60_03040 [Alphaproteobacteria bacterium]|nr:MAG: hypothetical protein EON60_03040 [Alphaproteobacteria bacterium]
MGSIIAGISSSSAKLNADFKVETQTYLEAVRTVVTTDITPEFMHANPNNLATLAAYLRGMPQLKQLASARTGDAATDAWGRELRGAIFTANEALQANVFAPVTGIALVSAGPDGVFQTTVPTVTQLSQVTGIAAPSGSDDIVVTFNNRRAQEDVFASMQAALRRIGTAAVKELQGRLATHREKQLVAYQKAITEGKSPDISMLDVSKDPTAPTFKKLDSTTAGLANRSALGIDGDFDMLQRTVKGGSMEVVATAPATAADPLILKLQNTKKATPWSKVTYQLEVTALD